MLIHVTKEYLTTVELLGAATIGARLAQRASTPGHPSGREFALALTAIEDAQMRYTRGRAMQLSQFSPADLDNQED